MPIVTVSPALDVRAGTIPGDGLSHESIDAEGLPILAGSAVWPLELEAFLSPSPPESWEPCGQRPPEPASNFETRG
jgi:hypothetical protein